MIKNKNTVIELYRKMFWKPEKRFIYMIMENK